MFVLVVTLEGMVWVADNFTIITLFIDFWHRETLIKHILIVPYDWCVSAELVIEFVLGIRQNISLVTKCGHMRSRAIWLGHLIVLTQIGVESASTMSRTVSSSDTTRVSGDVRVSSTTIGGVMNWFRMDVGQVVWGSLPLESESTKSLHFGWLCGWAEPTIVPINIAISSSSISWVELRFCRTKSHVLKIMFLF